MDKARLLTITEEVLLRKANTDNKLFTTDLLESQRDADHIHYTAKIKELLQEIEDAHIIYQAPHTMKRWKELKERWE